MKCKCKCHTSGVVKHIIPCCSMRLRDIVSLSINEALVDSTSSKEKEEQALVVQKLNQTAAVSSSKEKEVEEDAVTSGAPRRATPADTAQQSAQTQVQPPPPTAPEQIDADSIIDKFNIIRSGRSLSDRDVKDAMKNAFGSMAPGQKQQLYAVLQQIAQIVAPQVDATRSTPPQKEDPALMQARLKMLNQKAQQNTQPAQQPVVQTNNVQQAAPQKQKSKDEEDDSPPIKVGSKTSESVKKTLKTLIS